MTIAYIGIGSNLGDRKALVNQAVRLLRELPKTSLLKVATTIETEPIGRRDQPNFLNTVAEVETALNPRELLNHLHRIEEALGRERGEHWGPRTIDLDILLYGNLILNEPDLVIPHPHMNGRRFVLEPLTEIAPYAVHPTAGKSISELLLSLPGNKLGIRAIGDIKHIAIEGPIGAGKTTLAIALAERLDARLVLELSERNPFLEQFYSDMRRHAFHVQLSFLVSRYRQQAQITQRSLFQSRIVSDYILAKDRIFAQMNLTDDEMALYNQIYTLLSPRAAKPDVLVLITASPELLLENIAKRGIPCEQSISAAYLKQLCTAYEEFFKQYDETPMVRVPSGMTAEQVLEMIQKLFTDKSK